MLYVWGVAAVRLNASTMNEIEVRASILNGATAEKVLQEVLAKAVLVFPQTEFVIKACATPITAPAPYAWGVVAVKRNASSLGDLEIRAGIEHGINPREVGQKVLRHADIAFPGHTYAIKVQIAPVRDVAPLSRFNLN